MTLLAMMRRLLELKVTERSGDRDHPAIQWAHELCRLGESVADEIAWCSSIINLAAALTGYRRSRSAAARSWLNGQLGALVTDRSLFASTMRRLRGNENVVLIFKRGSGRGQLGADVLDAPGHVAVFLDYFDSRLHEVQVIGGNQSNAMTETWMPIDTLIGILVVTPSTS